MKPNWFDDFTRIIAGPQSRRQALKRIAGVIGGVLVAGVPKGALAAEGGNCVGNDCCADFCVDTFPPGQARGDCTSSAAHGGGPCFACGPSVPAGHPDVCGVGTPTARCCPTGTPTCCGGNNCVNTKTDLQNCGTCGHVCAAGQGCCNGVCTPLNTTQNCGTCGHLCAAGQGCCNGVCTPLNTTQNCGACGTACAAGQGCVSGVCKCTAASCPSGCCDAASTCQPGNTAAACGSAGGTCASCGPGTVCCGGKCVSNTCPDGQVFNPGTCTCGCPVGTVTCASTGKCVPNVCTITAQTYNPTTCVCECPPGEVVSGGVCITCGTQFVCGASQPSCGTPAPGGTCQCLKTVEGFTSCGENFSCGATSTCASSADCVKNFGPGAFCQAAGTGCCGANVCVPACGTPGFLAVPAGGGVSNAG